MMSIRSKIYIVFISSIMLLLSSCQGQSSVAKVVQVIDGDTVIIAGGYHVRYIGIDAPEKDEKYYLESTQLNKELIEGKRVRLEKDISEKDKYGRLLRYVYVDNTFVNAEIVRLGYAYAKAYPPDIKYQSYLEAMETEAKQTKTGIWK
jgi:micrococcal nuclease